MVKIKTGKIGVVQKTIVLITTKPNNANLNIYKSFISFQLVKLIKVKIIYIFNLYLIFTITIILSIKFLMSITKMIIL